MVSRLLHLKLDDPACLRDLRGSRSTNTVLRITVLEGPRGRPKLNANEPMTKSLFTTLTNRKSRDALNPDKTVFEEVSRLPIREGAGLVSTRPFKAREATQGG